MRGTLTMRPCSIDIAGDEFGQRLSIDGRDIGVIIPPGQAGGTMVRCLGLGHHAYLVRLNAYGESLASIRYEPNLLTDDELRGTILRRTKLDTAAGAELDEIAAKFGISREIGQ